MNGPLESKDDQRWLVSTLHALDHASRLAETAGEEGGFETASGVPGGVRAMKLCADVMRNAALIAGEITAPPNARGHAALQRELPEPPCAKELDDLQRTHRSATLSAAADGELTASEAMARVEAVRRLAAFALHAWRSAAHLAGHGA